VAKRTSTTPQGQSKSPAPNQEFKHSGWSDQKKKDYIKLLIRKLVTRESGLASLMLWIPMHLGIKEMDGIANAYADGHAIYFCDTFFTKPEANQLATVIHETLHTVLCHPQRSVKIHMQQGDKFSMDIANICADAIVIRAINQCKKIGPLEVTPNYSITAEDIVAPEDLKKIPGQQWSFEMLYHYIHSKMQSAIDKFLAKHGDKLDKDLIAGFSYDIHKGEVEARVWKERFKRAAAGSQPGSLLREILKDLPDSKTPWEDHFREFLIAHVMPTTTVDWSRPSRRLLSSKGRLGYYEPGIQRDLGVRKAGIVIDTSGSIDEPILNFFIAETNAIMEQTGCHVVLICADADVQSVDYFTDKVSGTYKAKGGGGTNFCPALKELEKHEIDCCVYLTDMCGTFPEVPPSYPVMWATLIDQVPPFGRLVKVEPKDASG
jgi:predicted metal-dependent peptidase